MSGQHTPGHWQVEGLTVTSLDWDGEKPTAVATMWPNLRVSEAESRSRTAANARLIAAAPDLLSVLSDFMESPQFQVAVGGNPIRVEDLMARASAAIAKARGEACS